MFLKRSYAFTKKSNKIINIFIQTVNSLESINKDMMKNAESRKKIVERHNMEIESLNLQITHNLKVIESINTILN